MFLPSISQLAMMADIPLGSIGLNTGPIGLQNDQLARPPTSLGMHEALRTAQRYLYILASSLPLDDMHLSLPMSAIQQLVQNAPYARKDQFTQGPARTISVAQCAKSALRGNESFN